jgi:hypothetical protein
VGGPHGGDGVEDSWSAAAPPLDAPAWFDPDAFVQGAKSHFIRLQAAWDRGDVGEIRSYTSPELFEELERERKALGAAPNETEVVRLDAELLGTRRSVRGDLARRPSLGQRRRRLDHHRDPAAGALTRVAKNPGARGSARPGVSCA